MTRKEIFVIIYLCIQYTCIQMGSLQIGAMRLDDLFIHVRRVCALKILVPFYLKVGGTALHYAASRGHVEVARELLNYKAYVNGRTKVCANNL